MSGKSILQVPDAGTSQYWWILEHYWCSSIAWNVTFTFFRMCWCYSEAYNTGTQQWSSIVQYSCTSIWDLKYTFSHEFACTIRFIHTCTHLSYGEISKLKQRFTGGLVQMNRYLSLFKTKTQLPTTKKRGESPVNQNLSFEVIRQVFTQMSFEF